MVEIQTIGVWDIFDLISIFILFVMSIGSAWIIGSIIPESLGMGHPRTPTGLVIWGLSIYIISENFFNIRDTA
jgi:hypothetical protein